MDFKNVVKNIQTTGYNGARTVSTYRKGWLYFVPLFGANCVKTKLDKFMAASISHKGQSKSSNLICLNENTNHYLSALQKMQYGHAIKVRPKCTGVCGGVQVAAAVVWQFFLPKINGPGMNKKLVNNCQKDLILLCLWFIS